MSGFVSGWYYRRILRFDHSVFERFTCCHAGRCAVRGCEKRYWEKLSGESERLAFGSDTDHSQGKSRRGGNGKASLLFQDGMAEYENFCP